MKIKNSWSVKFITQEKVYIITCMMFIEAKTPYLLSFDGVTYTIHSDAVDFRLIKPVVQLLEGVYCHGFVCIVYKLDVAWRRISLLSTYFYQVYEDKRLWIVTASDTLGKGVS